MEDYSFLKVMYLRSCKDEELQRDLRIYYEQICVCSEKIQRITKSERYIQCETIFKNYISEVSKYGYLHFNWTKTYFDDYYRFLKEIRNYEEKMDKAQAKYDAIKAEILKREEQKLPPAYE
jgi:hypothetical protein